jgi:type VI secretion system protein ImpM
MVHPSTFAAAAFGKLPAFGDFVREGELGGGEELFGWFEQGIAAASNRGSAWRDGFDRGALKAFVVPLSKGTLAVGVMAPSQDAVGRRFPFAVFGETTREAFLPGPHVLPLYLGNFLQGAGEVIEQATLGGRSTSALLQAVQPLDQGQFVANLDAYSAWVQAASLRTVGQAIFGADWRSGLAHALYICAESVRPFRGSEAPSTPLAVRLPLGNGSGGAASFWLHVVRAAAAWQTTIPSCFWSFDLSDPSITIFFGQLRASAFADLWEAAPDSDSLSDLTRISSSLAPHLREALPLAADLLERDESTVAGLIEVLAS